MSRSKEKKERSLGVGLQVKASRSSSNKAAIVRRPYPPGQHGQTKRMGNLSDFGIQLKEKQKCKVVYGIDDKALRLAFEKALRMSGSTATRLIELLESRIDNVIFRLGIAGSRAMARKIVLDGHILVNKRRVTSPGYVVKKKDIISIRPESAGRGVFRDLKETLSKVEIPAWLNLDLQKMEGHVVGTPEGVNPPFEVNLLVESFSK